MFDDLNLNMMLITTFVFLILIYLLNQILYKPLLSFMRNRELKLEEDALKTSKNNEEADESMVLVSQIINEAKARANEIKNDKLLLAKEKANKIISNKKTEINAKYEIFLSELEKERIELKNSLLGNSAEYESSLSKMIKKL